MTAKLLLTENSDGPHQRDKLHQCFPKPKNNFHLHCGIRLNLEQSSTTTGDKNTNETTLVEQ